MSMVLTVIISYLLINLAGSIYETIRDRKDFSLQLENELERFDRHKWYFKVGWFIGMVFVVFIQTLIWAPMELALSFRRRGE